MGRLVIISGDDDFAVKERARAVAGELAGGEFEENPAVEIIAGDGEELKPDAVVARFLDALRTPPFLSNFFRRRSRMTASPGCWRSCRIRCRRNSPS